MKKLGKYLLIILAVASLVYAGYTLGQVQNKAEVASQPELSKYDVGPPDPQEMLELVNEERKKVGVAPLVIDDNVQKAAQLKADDMAERNYFSHTMPSTGRVLNDEMDALLVASCRDSNENIQITESGTSRDAVAWWSQSKPHYEAMISPEFVKVGFGVVVSTDMPASGVKISDRDGGGRSYSDAAISVQHLCIAK